MGRFAFVGPSYTSQSVNADCQRCVNRYVETIESGTGKSAAALYPTPGLKTFNDTGEAQVRGGITIVGRTFFVAGTHLYEVLSNGGNTSRGTVSSDGSQASLAASSTQLMVASNGHLYCLTLATNAFVEIDTTTLVALQGRVSQVVFTDGYFLATLQNSGKFQLSALLDGTTWDPLDIAQLSLTPENIVAVVVDHREPWFFTSKAIVPYYDSGNPDFPYEPVPGAFIEQGCIAQNSAVKLDNSIFWIDQDERGGGIARRANGYTGVRVSNHAIEYAWSQYSTISDAIAYSYQDQGHTFWVIYFPTAGKTWVYDAATGTWHERESYANGVYGPHLSRCHVYAFGKHLVGDWNSGKIYEMSLAYYDENGTKIRRIRIAPHLATQDEWEYHQSMQIMYEMGANIALLDGNNNPRPAYCSLSWSDDYGHTWSNEYLLSLGMPGEYSTRAIKRRLGRARDRVYKVVDSDPIPSRIIDAYVTTPTYPPVPRLAAQLGKMA